MTILYKNKVSMINPSIIETIIILISLKLKLTISKWPIIKIKVTKYDSFSIDIKEDLILAKKFVK